MSTINRRPLDEGDMPIIAVDLPVIYEDDGQEELGETNLHTQCDFIIRTGISAHLSQRSDLFVYSNLDCYYHPIDRKAYISPDLMVVPTNQSAMNLARSYRIGHDGPSPLLALEILSWRSHQQQDLTNKPIIYANLGVPEYILVDPTGEFLAHRLLLRRLVDDETWEDSQDEDGGVTSALGFRIILDEDGLPRVLDAGTEYRYLRPLEAEAAARRARKAEKEAAEARRHLESTIQALHQAEERLRQLEAELARLRRPPEAQS